MSLTDLFLHNVLERVGHLHSKKILFQQPMLVPDSVLGRINRHPTFQDLDMNKILEFPAINTKDIRSRREDSSAVACQTDYQHYSLSRINKHGVCKALKYSSIVAYYYCSKAVYWGQDPHQCSILLMLQQHDPISLLAIVATVPRSCRQAQSIYTQTHTHV